MLQNLIYHNTDKKNKQMKNKNKLEINLKKQINEKFGIIGLVAVVLLIIALIIIFFNYAKTNESQFNKCEAIILNSYKNSCLMSLANTTKNISICNNVDQINKNKCILDIANLKNNTNFCNLINNSTLSYNCILNIGIKTQNQTICSNLNGSFRASCLYYFAKLNNFNNINVCKSITNTSDQNICTNLFYYNEMIRTKNQNYCSNLLNQSNFTILNLMLNNNINKSVNLVNNIAKTANSSSVNNNILNEAGSLNLIVNSSSSIIQLMSYNITPQNFCYFNSAIISKNSSICSQTGNLGFACNNELSSQQISNKTSNLTAQINNCNKLASYNLTSLCSIGIYTTYAIKTRNISICLKISNIYEKNICITNMALQLNNSNYCSYLNNTTIESSCQQTI